MIFLHVFTEDKYNGRKYLYPSSTGGSKKIVEKFLKFYFGHDKIENYTQRGNRVSYEERTFIYSVYKSERKETFWELD